VVSKLCVCYLIFTMRAIRPQQAFNKCWGCRTVLWPQIAEGFGCPACPVSNVLATDLALPKNRGVADFLTLKWSEADEYGLKVSSSPVKFFMDRCLLSIRSEESTIGEEGARFSYHFYVTRKNDRRKEISLGMS
jgi:hypothetical protein